MTRLFVSLGALPVLAFRLAEGETRLGRSPDNDLVLSLPEIADTHATILRQGDRTILRVTEGETLFVNGQSVESADLRDGDEIAIGGYRLVLRARPKKEEASAGGEHTTSPLDEGIDPGRGVIRRVVVTLGRDAGREVGLDERAVVIGRAPECDFVLHDDTVSWRHVRIEPGPGVVRITDLGSRNGTFLDGQRIESAPAMRGARLRIGRTTLVMKGSPHDSGIHRPPGETGLAELVGGSGTMRRVYDRIREAATTRVPVLICGETGTGKELTARAIHSLGSRSSGPFVPINCAAVPKDLLESELFGHRKGTFTGADRDQVGLFQQAHGGTVFLDEISELPLDLQPKLLRAIEDGSLPRLGGSRAYSDFRVLAATNRDLEAAVEAGRFRPDLFYRLAVVRIDLPPLSDRLDDLSDLVQTFLEKMEAETGISGAGRTHFEEEAFVPLREYAWPGNVRELRNLIYRAVMRSRGEPVTRDLIEDLMIDLTTASNPNLKIETLEDAERVAIRNTLRDCGGSRRETARRLGIAESTLYEKIRRYGLTEVGRDT